MGTNTNRVTSDPWSRWGWLMAAVWLVFLAFPIQALQGSSAPGAALTLGWAGLVSFAVVYLSGFTLALRGPWKRPSPLVRVLFATMIVCGAATVPAIGTASLGLIPFAFSYAAYGLTQRWYLVTVMAGLTLAVTWLATSGTFGEHIEAFMSMLLVAATNSILVWLITRSMDAETVRVELAASDERATIARDVHDLLGHTLTAVKLKAELAQRLIERDPQRAQAELAQIVVLAADAIAGVRSTVTGLRAPGIEEQLAASAAALQTAGHRVEISGSAAALSPAQSIPAGWILREATTNILRHAHATQVHISLAPGEVTITDNGRGLAEHHPLGNGLRGMAERASAASAVLRVEEAAPGTKVSVIW